MPIPVSMTGTVDSVTTVWMRLAPPRGMTRSTRPRAVISARAASCPPPSSRHTAFSSIPWAARASRITATSARLLDAAADPPRRITALPLLRAEGGGVHRDVGSSLVDHPDHAHRDPHLADLQAVGQRRTADDLTDGVGQRRDVAHRLGDRADPPVVERESVEEPVGEAVLAAALEVLGVGRDDLAGGRDEGVGDRVERLVLGRPREQRELSGGPAGPLGECVHLFDRGRVDRSGGHASRVRRVLAAPPRGFGGRGSRGYPLASSDAARSQVNSRARSHTSRLRSA